MLVPGALNDTQKIRKAGADIFAIVGADKPKHNFKKSGRGLRLRPPSPPGLPK